LLKENTRIATAGSYFHKNLYFKDQLSYDAKGVPLFFSLPLDKSKKKSIFNYVTCISRLLHTKACVFSIAEMQMKRHAPFLF